MVEIKKKLKQDVLVKYYDRRSVSWKENCINKCIVRSSTAPPQKNQTQ